PVEVLVFDDALHLLLAQRLGVLLAVPRLDLPAGLPVVGGDSGHALNLKLLAHEVRPLVLLDDDGLEAAAAVELARAPQALDGLYALHAADGLDELGDDLVGRLR